MSLRPVDLQVMVPKMTEVARAQNSESARQLITAQRGADSAKEMVEADVREVHAKKDAQRVNMRVGREGEKGDQGGKKRRRDRGRSERHPVGGERRPVGGERHPVGDERRPAGGEAGHIDILL